MTCDDVFAALSYLGLDLAGLADIVGESEQKCRAWLNGLETPPRWLDHLFFCWSEHPDTFALARQDATLRSPVLVAEAVCA